MWIEFICKPIPCRTNNSDEKHTFTKFTEWEKDSARQKTLNVRILFMFRPNFFAIEFQAEYVHYAGRACILSVIAFGKSCRDAVNGEFNVIESKMEIMQKKFTRDTPEPSYLPIAEGISNWNLYNNHNRNQEQVKCMTAISILYIHTTIRKRAVFYRTMLYALRLVILGKGKRLHLTKVGFNFRKWSTLPYMQCAPSLPLFLSLYSVSVNPSEKKFFSFGIGLLAFIQMLCTNHMLPQLFSVLRSTQHLHENWKLSICSIYICNSKYALFILRLLRRTLIIGPT